MVERPKDRLFAEMDVGVSTGLGTLSFVCLAMLSRGPRQPPQNHMCQLQGPWQFTESLKFNHNVSLLSPESIPRTTNTFHCSSANVSLSFNYIGGVFTWRATFLLTVRHATFLLPPPPPLAQAPARLGK